MRHLLFICLFVFFSTSTFAKKSVQNFQFLTPEQFEQLTTSEQKLYIQTYVQIFSNLSEEVRVSLFQSLFLPSAFAQNERTSYSVESSDPDIELNKLKNTLLLTKKLEEARKDQKLSGSSGTGQHLQDYKAEIIRRLKQIEPKLTNQKQVGIYNELRNEFGRQYKSSLSQVPRSNRTMTGQAQITPQLSTSKAATTKPKQSSPSTQEAQLTQFLKSEKTNYYGLRPYCIYAGFPVDKKPCEPFKELPDQLVLNELKQDLFKCANDKEILCNPLLFGYIKNCYKFEGDMVCNHKPVCIQRSKNATQNCIKKSSTTDLENTVLEIWKNPKNKNVISYMNDQLKGLCSETSQAVQDIQQTCKVAVQKFNSVMEKSFPAGLNNPEKTQQTPKAPTPKPVPLAK